MARIRLRHCHVRFLDGFRATAKVAVGAVPATTDTTLAVDELAVTNPVGGMTIPVGTRFTIAGVNQIYTVTAVVSNDIAGAVNAVPVDTDTTLLVDSIVGRIPVGATFTIVGSTLTFTVVSTIETGADTTSITFTPAIATATGVPADDAVITFAAHPTSISFTPALLTAANIPAAGDVITVLGRCLDAKIGDGNITWDSACTNEYEMDRGTIDAVVEGDDIPLDVKLDLVYEFLTAITGSGTPTPEDVLKQRGEAANWITSGADPCELYSVDVEVDYAPPCNIDHEIITFREFRWESVSHDISQATLATSGKCKLTDVVPIRRAY